MNNEQIIKHIIDKNLIKTKDLTFCELGVWKGTTTNFLLKNYDIKKYYGVDSYGVDSDGSTQEKLHNIPIVPGDINVGEIENIYKQVTNMLSGFTQFDLIRESTNTAHHHIHDEELDIIYIDAGHTYEDVMYDLVNYYPKVKNGGLLIGDDYFMTKKSYGVDMVYEAVNEFAFNNNYKVLEYGDHGGLPWKWAIQKS